MKFSSGAFALFFVLNCVNAWTNSRSVERSTSRHSIQIYNQGGYLFAPLQKDLWPSLIPSQVIETLAYGTNGVFQNLLSEISTAMDRVLQFFIFSFINKVKSGGDLVIGGLHQGKSSVSMMLDTMTRSYAKSKPLKPWNTMSTPRGKFFIYFSRGKKTRS